MLQKLPISISDFNTIFTGLAIGNSAYDWQPHGVIKIAKEVIDGQFEH